MLAADNATGWTADDAVTRLFAAHYRPLVRLATLLLADSGRAEEIVSDAYVALHGSWRRLHDTDKALAYLRATVVNRSRSALRHRRVVERHATTVAMAEATATAPSAEAGALDRLAHDVVLAALAELPARQREALVLRYYGDLSEVEIAEAMGCSRGAVKSHTARGMAALRTRMEQWA
jgi:RNA polymerase sigma-70 factor (sigma-E family)